MIVLTVEQMKTLQDKGLDITKYNTNLYWSYLTFYTSQIKPFWNLQVNQNNKQTWDKDNIPAFTLEDILNIIELSSELIYILMDNCIFVYSCEQDVANDIPLHKEWFSCIKYKVSMLDGCFNILLWCLNNGYIK